MSRETLINPESFEALLVWLDESREVAGQKYETIRRGLIKIFIAHRCCDAEDLADLTINRVIIRLPDIVADYEGEPVKYFRGVARNVLLETRRRKEIASDLSFDIPAPREGPAESDELECLRACLKMLPHEQRELMLDYYLNEKRLKIDHRKQLAEELGISTSALRVRAHRIRVNLQDCVWQCVSGKSETNCSPKSII